MSLISHRGILQLLLKGVVENSSPDHVNAASLDLTLGKFILAEKLGANGTHYKANRVSLADRTPLHTHKIDLEREGSFILQPGQFILAQTREIFNLPNYISSEYKLKSSMARIGLEHLNAGWCLDGDTSISLLNGTEQTISSLVGKQFWVYSVDTDTGKIVPGFVSAVFETKKVTKLLEIVLDTGTSFRCTPEHQLMLRDGTYLEAQRCVEGQSLMPLYRKINQGKEFVLDTSLRYRKIWEHTHRLVYKHLLGEVQKHHVVHHLDHNPRNNSPENLQCQDRWTHIAAHNILRNQSEAQRAAASKAMANTNKKLWADEDFRARQIVKNHDLAVALNERQWNHSIKTITAIEHEEPVPVYDMTVDTYHNFALSSGVFVHNCDAGWNGSVLTLEFRNMTTFHEIELKFGDKIGQMIFFEHEDVPTEASYAAKGAYNNHLEVSSAAKLMPIEEIMLAASLSHPQEGE